MKVLILCHILMVVVILCRLDVVVVDYLLTDFVSCGAALRTGRDADVFMFIFYLALYTLMLVTCIGLEELYFRERDK